MVAPLRTCRRRVAVLAIALVVFGVCFGTTQAPNSTGERGKAAFVSAVSHHAPASIQLDGLLTMGIAAILALAWTLERTAVVRALVPAATMLILRRGPPVIAH